MVLTLTLHGEDYPATDLGFLLHKAPDKMHMRELPFGRAYVFYPEASESKCTAALLFMIDPIGLVRKPGPRGESFALEQYVNDRPYVASSFLSVALARIFGTALGGRSKHRPELALKPLPLEAALAVVPCREDETFLQDLFGPLGYGIETERLLLDETFPEWGPSPYVSLRLKARVRLQDLLAHLYVLLPVLDDDKHYWVGEAEVEKLLHRGAGWLSHHPLKEKITRRYLKHQRSLTTAALARLEDEVAFPGFGPEAANSDSEVILEEPLGLNHLRIEAVRGVLRESDARQILDLGCGEGKLLARLLEDPFFERVVGMDVSSRMLDRAERRLRLRELSPRRARRVKLLQSSLAYRDSRWNGYDAAVLQEVIEHIPIDRLPAMERALFGFARPPLILVTTPNREYNVRFSGLLAGTFRHPDHRFEWTRKEFEAWASQTASRFGYAVSFRPIGPADESAGSPTQMGVFRRE